MVLIGTLCTGGKQSTDSARVLASEISIAITYYSDLPLLFSQIKPFSVVDNLYIYHTVIIAFYFINILRPYYKHIW